MDRPESFVILKDLAFATLPVLAAYSFGQVQAIWALSVLCIAFVAVILLLHLDHAAFVNRVREIITAELRVPWRPTQYSRRKNHFVEEKQLLAQLS